MKRVGYILVLLIGLMLFLSRCVVGRMQWSDQKAERVFASKGAPLVMHDTVVDNRHIHYAVTGPDTLPVLVFIHGSPGTWFHYMRFMWDEDLRKKYRMISVDRPGYGHSDYGQALPLDEQKKLLLPVLQQIKNDKPMYGCGHSYGGPLLAALAAEDTSLFHTILIVAGALDPSLEKKETWRSVMEHWPLNAFLPGAFQPSNTELLYLKKDLYPLEPRLANIRANVVFLHGDRDTWVPIENVGFGIRKMTNAASIRSDTLPGADHQVPWKRPAEFKKTLLSLY